MNIKHLFDKPKVIGMVANADEGKSNTLYYILDELNKDYKFSVWVYGLKCSVPGTRKFNSIAELEQIKDSLIIIDEMFSLFDLDNRKIKKQIEDTIRLIFHNNNILLLCGLGENFKKFISAKIHVLICKKITFSDLINGSSVKNRVMAYQGKEKGSTVLNMRIDECLVYDGEHYHTIKIPYLKQYDTKLNNKPIFVSKIKKNVSENVQKKKVLKSVK